MKIKKIACLGLKVHTLNMYIQLLVSSTIISKTRFLRKLIL